MMVSVIIPVFNSREWLAECVDSVQLQTYTDLEILLIDDGSNDGSGQICDKLASMDSRIVVIHQQNAGVSAARNTGLAHAAGEFVMFVDSDDELVPDAVEKMASAAAEHRADLVISGYSKFGCETASCPAVDGVAKDAESRYSLILADYNQNMLHSVCAKLFRKEKIQEEFLAGLSTAEDALFSVSFLPQAEIIVSLPLCLYQYRRMSATSLSTRFQPNRFEAEVLLFQKTDRCFRELSGQERTEPAAASYLVRSTLSYLYRLDGSNLQGEEKKRLFREVCSSDDLKRAYRASRPHPLRRRIFYLLIRLRCFTVLAWGLRQGRKIRGLQ